MDTQKRIEAKFITLNGVKFVVAIDTTIKNDVDIFKSWEFITVRYKSIEIMNLILEGTGIIEKLNAEEYIFNL
jgi:hypothetical protein